MQANAYFLGGLFVLLLAGGGGSMAAEAESCSMTVSRELNLGGSFNPEMAALIDSHYSNEACYQLLANLLQELANFFNLEQWNHYEKSIRFRLANQVMPLMLFRAFSLDKLSDDASKALNNALKSSVLAGNLFQSNEQLNNTSCSLKMQLALQVEQPFVPQLAAFINTFDTSECNMLASKLKSSLLELSLLKKNEWLAQSERAKELIIQNVLQLLHVRAKMVNETKLVDPSERAWYKLIKSNLLLDDVFIDPIDVQLTKAFNKTASGGGKNGTNVAGVGKPTSVWHTVLWLVLILCFCIAVFLGLRYLDMIPSNF